MSLERYINRETIVDLNDPQYGQLFTDGDLKILSPLTLHAHDPTILASQQAELHIYSSYGDYIAGDHSAQNLVHDKQTNSLLVDVGASFREAEISRGSYVVVLNLFRPVWGSFDAPVAVVREISPDRTEIKLALSNKQATGELQQFKQTVQGLAADNILNNLVVNFGHNRIQKIINARFDPDGSTFYLKLYQPIFDSIEEKNTGWFAFEVLDPYIDTVLLTAPVDPGQTVQLRGPNFNIDTSQYASNATMYQTWNELLDANLPTSQRIIDTALSSSGTARLNIDYTDFANFVFYGSAQERVENFYYKLGRIEEYNESIRVLQASTASITTFVSSSVDVNRRRIDQITTTFDPFERWMYYETTASIFSHAPSGSMQPYPKYIQSGAWTLHDTTSSIAKAWYSGSISSASYFDVHNVNRLYWSIPEHVYMDAGNSDYTTFVDMVGQHFDVLYSYVRALTQIHERDEHPERGPSNDLLYYIAKSFGWNLQNTRQLADLWRYKLGMTQDGVYDSTGSMFSTSHENQTQQIWRRTVNNLPYLLKTKGTQRSVKALMSIFGIPQTLISIKEYGGPSVSVDRPSFAEDRFSYKLNLSGSQWVEMNRRPVPPASGSWSGVSRVPDTVEFRFATAYSSSVSMSLWAIEDGTDRTKRNAALDLYHVKATTGEYLYSGSYAYGYLRLTLRTEVSGGVDTYQSQSSAVLPLFDGDMWTVRMYTTASLTDAAPSGSIFVDVGRVHDSIPGRISHTASFTLASSVNIAKAWGGTTSSIATPGKIMLGGSTSSLANLAPMQRFVGFVQGYKEYFDTYGDSTFQLHMLNPAAYSTDVVSGSFYSLYRYYPLGLDVQRWDHTAYLQVSSSQPNRRASFDTTASFKGFTGGQTNHYRSNVETHYVYVPTLGGAPLLGEKMRLEETRLLRQLTPDGRSTRSTFDRASTDSNRLAIVFAPADHVNRDIYDHSGKFELDTFLGDPQFEFDEDYGELKRFGDHYWQKYQQRNDINALIRIFSVYDYTFFEQIRQVVPGRADLIAGILIEPNVLERSKVRMTRRPTVENPQYEKTLPLLSPTQSGEYLTYEGAISGSGTPTIAYQYITGSIEDTRTFTLDYLYYTGSISDPLTVTALSLHHLEASHSRTGLCGEIDTIPSRYTGSQGETCSYVDTEHIRQGCCYKRVEFHYSASGTFETRYLRQWYAAVSKSYGMYYSKSLNCTNYQINECSTQNYSRFVGSRMTGADFNIDSPDTVDGGPVVEVYESNPNNLFVGGGDGGSLRVE
jgi:hypothetical protein